MRKSLTKLAMAACGMGASLALLTGAGFAWYSISTSPEIRGITIGISKTGKEFPFEISMDYGEKGGDAEAATWTTTLNLSQTDLVKNYNTLRPISTYDGKHWYLPLYSATGAVKSFVQAEESIYANHEKESNYFSYVDLWIRTEDPDASYTVRLSNPADMNKLERGETHYGTFVLGQPWKKETDQRPYGDDALTCLRIGFQFMSGDGIDRSGESLTQTNDSQRYGEEEETFFIYEPNADKRASSITPFITSGGAQGGLKYSTDVGYIRNKSESETEDPTALVTVKNYKDNYLSKMDGKIVPTTVPRYDPDLAAEETGPEETVPEEATPAETTPTEEISVIDYQLVELGGADDTDPTTVLFRQKESKWKSTASSKTAASVTSRDVDTIGSFLDADGNAVTGNLQSMTTLTKGNVKKLRIYFWLEGQDIDCWNQIAGGTLYANLELTGDAVTEGTQP